jgi:aspartyl-tRNA(Asn)/glutamyl-tRNA(Gln) amidotransferase subunit B
MEFETVIGLEVHVELSTDSKIYCTCSTEFGAEENAHICRSARNAGTLPR